MHVPQNRFPSGQTLHFYITQMNPYLAVLEPGVAVTCPVSLEDGTNPYPPPCFSISLPSQPAWTEDGLPGQKVYAGTLAFSATGASTKTVWKLGGSTSSQTDRKGSWNRFKSPVYAPGKSDSSRFQKSLNIKNDLFSVVGQIQIML